MLTTTNVTSVRRHVYLFGDVGFPDDIEQEMQKWDAEWNYPIEEVVLHINSYGGSIDGMNSLLLRLSQVGSLYTVVEGKCMSAALILFLQGHQRAATKDSLFMAHNAVLYNTTRSDEVQVKNLNEYTKFVSDMSKNMLTEHLYEPKFINKRELEDIVNGNELYIDYEEAQRRKIINFELEDVPPR